MYERNAVRTLYKKLLALYPRDFREALGESMEQTFHDLYLECKRGSKRGLFRFVLWMFVETAIAILKEHVLLIRQGETMKSIFTNIKSPAIISLLLILPLMILEIVNRRNFNEGFPIPLFVILWLLPVLFIVAVLPLVRNLRAGNSLIASPVSLLIRVVVLVFIAWLWTGILIDQIPCFLGVPNCD